MKKTSAIILLTLMALLALSPWAAANGTTGSIVRVTGNIVVGADEVVHGDVISVMGNIEVYGTVYGDVITVMGNIEVGPNGRILGDAVAVLGNLNSDRNSSISGSTVSIFGSGDFRNIRFPDLNIRNITRHAFRFNLATRTMRLITTILLATLIVAIFPVPVQRIKRSIEADPGRVVLTGLLAWIVIVPLAVILTLTIIGIPLAALLGAAVWAAGRMGEAALVLLIGRALLKETESLPAVAAFGALLLGVAHMIPMVGSLVGLAVSLAAIGAVTLTRFGTAEISA
jgi:hypothetical protein